MKNFDRFSGANRALYDDRAYKILTADKAVDTGLTEVKVYKNGKTRKKWEIPGSTQTGSLSSRFHARWRSTNVTSKQSDPACKGSSEKNGIRKRLRKVQTM